jgi:hypothetical protein
MSRVPIPGFATLLGLVWLLTAALLVVDFWPLIADTLSDSDDAMRLVEVRAFLAGRGWFDLGEPRVQPPLGYETHWSRLIDAGLAGLFVLLRPFAEAGLAERLMRALWPLLWLLPTMAGAAAIAWRLAGREAALIVLLFVFLGAPAYERFNPGRIDHHNVQIALTLLTIAATVWSDRVRGCAVAAGLLTGLACTIGLESLPFLVLCAIAFAWRYAADQRGGPPFSEYGYALAASAIAAFFVSVDPQHWLRNACDAIAINWVVPMIIGGLGAGLIGQTAHPRVRGRAVAAVMVAAAAAIPFVLIEPRCLGGPYAMMDAAAKPIWLAQVREMQPLLTLARTSPVKAAWIAAFPLAALGAALVLAQDNQRRRDFAFLVASGALVLACLTMFAAMKGYTYAVWLAIPVMAAAAPRLFARFDLRMTAARLTAAAVLSPTAIAAAAIGLVQAIPHAAAETGSPDREACLKTENYASLARLPAGVVAADVDYGPFLLALTPHAVVGAPYHRMAAAILAAHQIFALPPDEARRILARSHATYVVICGRRPPPGLTGADLAASLWGQLQAGRIPDWLQAVAENETQAFRVYRLADVGRRG